jgi:RNA polymerase sigma-70 factor (sigma-E family)
MASDEAFAAFMRANSASLFRTAFLLTGARASAEDLLQETLTRLYPKWDVVSRADSPIAYVRRSLTNAFISSGRRKQIGTLSRWERPDGWDRAGDEDPEDEVANRELVWQLLGALPRRQRAAVVMRYFHGMPDDEIASNLGCRAVTVRSLVSRAVAGMRAGSGAQPDTNGRREHSR